PASSPKEGDRSSEAQSGSGNEQEAERSASDVEQQESLSRGESPDNRTSGDESVEDEDHLRESEGSASQSGDEKGDRHSGRDDSRV
ncbi:MAG: hypothetical protein M3Q07_10995, partial [Pseudobdellovibrionaceae bacterium]|nr:hypothetical protein [Pseudobdellovibrionaceae bacterium]